ncbi:efflux RND transporter permease subunit [Lentisphaerota bacterium ZTH]|nr:efflux RND transporter permease subunit [Lentisphaerota bacterium]WET06879.1 efflux RND transporter permease subunit [Lentisphaerota bacterium ZTH]
MKLVESSIKYRTVVFSLAVVGFIWGIWQYQASPRREDPEFTLRYCTVITKWPGATASQIEELVCDPLEREISGIDEVKETTATINPGLCTIKVTMEDAVDNVDEVCDIIRAQIPKVKLPPGASTPYVNSKYADTSAMMLAVYQIPQPGTKIIENPYSMRKLQIICEEIRDKLKQLESVATVTIMSDLDEAIYIEPNAGDWSRIQVSIEQLAKRLEAKNKLIPGGVLDTGKQALNVSVKGDYDTVNQIKRTIVSTSTQGLPVSVQTLGLNVSRDYIDPPPLVTRYSDHRSSQQRCILVHFTMKKGRNIVKLGEQVRNSIKAWEKTFLPPDVKVAVVADQPKDVMDNINVFVINLLQAICILVIVAWLLIGKRVAVIMASAIPVIVMISFAIVRLFNVQLEKMSIASLIISLGMLVDCAIEICDNVHRLQEEGYSRFNAAVTGTRQVIYPILMGTLTTVFAFLPMITVPGNPGEYIYSIPIVVSVTLLTSWVVAITFTVTLTWLLLKPGTDKIPPLTRLINFIRGKKTDPEAQEHGKLLWYRSLLEWSIKHRATIITAAFALFALTVVMLKTGIINTDFIPSSGGSQLLIDIWLPEGTSIKKTSQVCCKVERIIEEQSKIINQETGVEPLKNSISFCGESAPRFKLSVMPEFPKSNYAQVLLNGTTPKLMNKLTQRVTRQCNERLTEARISPKRIGMGPGAKYPIMIRLLGDDYIILKKYAGEIKKILKKIPGTLDIHDGWGNLACQVNVMPDEEKCAAAGVTRTAAANTLNAFFSGSLLTTFREGDHQVPVYFRLPWQDRNQLSKLKELYLEGTSGKVPLTAVSEIKLSFEPGRIERYCQQRNMEILGQVADGFLATAVINQALPKLKDLNKKMPTGYSIEIGGTYEKAQEGSRDIGKAMLIAFALIVLSLVVYFNSLIKAFAVILTLPLACTGAFLGLFIMNQPLGFFAQLGLLSLFGIIVNGAIVLFDFISMLVHDKTADSSSKNGLKKYNGLTKKQFTECVINGGALRLRPIALTTFTTTGGLLPLAISGGPLFQPLAVVIIFGLLYGTTLTLILMPVIYSILVEKFNMRIGRTEEID